MTGFRHDIAGGQGNLIADSVQSPNFQLTPTFQGWQINKDGTAYFADIVLPEGQGVSVFFAASPPLTSHVGDLWYNISNGLQLSQWNGSSWVPYQIGSGAIATGGIQPSNIDSLTASLIGQLGGILNPNPFLTGGDPTTYFANNASSSGVTATPPSPPPYPFAYQAVSNGAGTLLIGQLKAQGQGEFSIQPSTQYLVTGWIYSTASLTFNVGLDWLNSSFNVVSNSSIANAVAANTWTPISAVVTSPTSGVIAARTNLSSTIFPSNGTTVDVAGLTVFPQVPGSLIQANTITTTELAAGIIYAGIVNGTQIQGAQFIADGTSGELLIYSSSPPAHGNLIASISPVAGSDGHSNNYVDTFAAYGPNGGTVQVAVNQTSGQPFIIFRPAGGVSINTGVWPQVYGTVGNPGGANEYPTLWLIGGAEPGPGTSAQTYIQVTGEANDSSTVGVIQHFIDGNNVMGITTGYIQAYKPVFGTNPSGIVELSWHNVTPPAGWSGTLRYKIDNNNGLWVQCDISNSSGTSGTLVLFTLPSGYVPSVAGTVFPRLGMGTASYTAPGINWSTAGAITAVGLPPGTTLISFLQWIPLD